MTKEYRILFMVLVVLASLWGRQQEVFAQGPPINTDTPILLGLDGSGIRTFGRIIYRGTLLQDGSEIDDPTDSRIRIWASPVVVPHNLFSDKLQVRLIVPFLNVDVSSNNADNSSTGIGDLDFSAKYEVFRRDAKGQTFRVASRIGIRLPTGDEDDMPPLGSGSTNYYFTTVAGFIKNRIGIYLEGIYNLNTSNDTFDLGNSFNYNLAFGYRLLPKVYETYPSPQLNGFLELNGTTVNKNSLDDQSLQNSGGTTIFLSPGIQYIGGRRWLIEAAFQYPIVNEPNGTQLATDWRVSLGTRILIF